MQARVVAGAMAGAWWAHADPPILPSCIDGRCAYCVALWRVYVAWPWAWPWGGGKNRQNRRYTHTVCTVRALETRLDFIPNAYPFYSTLNL
jgi:hypothetical protein